MANESSLIALLQPTTPVENPGVNQTKNSSEENHFQNVLEEASRKSKPSEESGSTRRERQGEQTTSKNEPKTDKPSSTTNLDNKEGNNQTRDNEETFESELTSTKQEANATNKTETTQDLDNEETFESQLTSTNQEANPITLDNESIPQEGANSFVDFQNAFVEGLNSQGIDQERIDAFLRLLGIETSVGHTINLDNQDISQERANLLVDFQDTFIGDLKSIGNDFMRRFNSFSLDQEEIDPFLRLLEIDTSADDAEELLMALAGQLNLQQNDKLISSLNSSQDVKNLTSLTSMRDRLASDFLYKAGLSKAEAKTFLQKIFQAQTNVVKVQENLKQNARQAKAESIAKQTATTTHFLENGAQAAKAHALETKGQITAELIKNQRLEAQKLISQEQAGNTRNSLSSERIKTQDPLVKVLNPQQTGKNPLNESTGQTTLLSSQNLRNTQDIISPFDHGPAKILVESLPQNSYQSVEKFSAQTEVLKQTFKETPLPRGVTESKIIDQIIQKFSARGSGAKNEVNIRLEPPSLGKVRMNVSSTGDSIKTILIAENHAVKQAIESNLSQLKSSLSQQGLAVESFDVLVGGDPNFKGQNQQQGGNGRSNGFATKTLLNQETLEPVDLENASPVLLGDETISVFV